MIEPHTSPDPAEPDEQPDLPVEPGGSAHQDAWVELAVAVREQLRKRAKRLPEMDADDCKTFVAACQAAIALEWDARGFDKTVELHEARTAFGD